MDESQFIRNSSVNSEKSLKLLECVIVACQGFIQGFSFDLIHFSFRFETYLSFQFELGMFRFDLIFFLFDLKGGRHFKAISKSFRSHFEVISKSFRSHF